MDSKIYFFKRYQRTDLKNTDWSKAGVLSTGALALFEGVPYKKQSASVPSTLMYKIKCIGIYNEHDFIYTCGCNGLNTYQFEVGDEFVIKRHRYIKRKEHLDFLKRSEQNYRYGFCGRYRINFEAEYDWINRHSNNWYWVERPGHDDFENFYQLTPDNINSCVEYYHLPFEYYDKI